MLKNIIGLKFTNAKQILLEKKMRSPILVYPLKPEI